MQITPLWSKNELNNRWGAPAVTKVYIRILAGLAAAMAICAAPAVCAPGQPQPTNLPEAFSLLRTSHELAALAQRSRDPWGLAMAARLRLRAGAGGVLRVEDGRAGVQAADLRGQADAWLKQAERWGEGDARLLSFIGDVRAEAGKGRMGGPRISTASLGGGGRHRYSEPFISGVPAVVYLEGDGDAALSLRVTGAAGETACSQGGADDAKLCAWTPLRSQTYTVEINNAGVVEARYALGTN